MSYRNIKRGRSRVHTLACYNDTWRKFQNFKHIHHLVADKALNLLVDNYNEKDKRNLIGLIKMLKVKLNSLN